MIAAVLVALAAISIGQARWGEAGGTGRSAGQAISNDCQLADTAALAGTRSVEAPRKTGTAATRSRLQSGTGNDNPQRSRQSLADGSGTGRSHAPMDSRRAYRNVGSYGSQVRSGNRSGAANGNGSGMQSGRGQRAGSGTGGYGNGESRGGGNAYRAGGAASSGNGYGSCGSSRWAGASQGQHRYRGSNSGGSHACGSRSGGGGGNRRGGGGRR